MIKIMHVITGLGVGGAEMMLLKLISGLNKPCFSHCVISLKGMPGSTIYNQLKAQGIPVFCLDLTRVVTLPFRLFQLVTFIRKFQPRIVQSWMYHGDFIGSIIGLIYRIPVVWNLRQSNLADSHTKKTTRALITFLAGRSRHWPYRIVCGSHAAKRAHIDQGYDDKKMTVIPNGFDLEQFSSKKRGETERLRKELGLKEKDTVVGIIGRFDPQKDYRNFIKACSIIIGKYNNEIQVLMCGTGISPDNELLCGWLKTNGVRENALLLGERHDIPLIMTLLTVLVSSSLGEGFPNVVGEGMATGIPCVVTDVGDSSYLVGDTGSVVPPEDPEMLADAVLKVLELPETDRIAMGLHGQKRIRENFSLASVSRKYEELYTEIIKETTC